MTEDKNQTDTQPNTQQTETNQATQQPEDGKQTQSAHAKPLLTVDQQIAHMKSKGITFNLCSEAEAAEHLRTKCQFFRVYAYRKLFDKHVGGDLDGQYVGLDFGHLRALSRVDRKLRDTLLPMTLDVEHFAKVRLLALAEEHDEDGYAIVHGYLGSVSKKQRDHVATELDRRKNDPYSGSLVTKYRNDMPLWVIIEVVSFGTFLDILKYCAEHWGDTDLKRTHYLLKKAKSVRNFCAHGLCALNDLTGGSSQRERTPVALAKAMADRGIPKRLRSKRLASLRMVQICTLVYVYATTVPQGRTRDDRVSELRKLFAYAAEQLSALPPQNQARAALSFIERLTRALGLLD